MTPASRSYQFLTSGARGSAEVEPNTVRSVGCCVQPFVVSEEEEELDLVKLR